MGFWIGFTFIFLLAAFAASIHIFSKETTSRLVSNAQTGFFAAALAGMSILTYQWLSPHVSTGNISMNFYLATLLIVLTASVLGLLSQLWRHNAPLLFALIVSSLLTFALVLAKHDSLGQTKHYDITTIAHAAFSFCGFGFFGLATLQAVCIKISYYILKRKRGFDLLKHFPPILKMEKLLFIEILIGFILLTFAFITGYFAQADIFDNTVIHKTILSLASWLIFGYLLIRYYTKRISGQSALNYILIAFFLLIFAFLGSLFVREVVLG